MKKLLALTLALVLALSLGTAALAFEWEDAGEYGDPYGWGYYWGQAGTDGAGIFAPNSVYPVFGDDMPSDLKNNLRLVVEWEKGGAMVESVKWKKLNDGWGIALTLHPNYTIEDAKELVGKIELIAKATGNFGGQDCVKGEVCTTFAFGPEDERLFVANAVEEVQGTGKADDADEYDITGPARDHIIYKCDEDSPGYVKFNSAGASLFQITAKMARKEKLHMHLVEDDGDVLDALDELGVDPDAIAHTYTLEGNVGFKNPAKFTLQADYDEQYFVYEWDGKKLTKQDYTWNSIDGVYEWNNTKMMTFVIADKELVAAEEEEETVDKNPDTGA